MENPKHFVHKVKIDAEKCENRRKSEWLGEICRQRDIDVGWKLSLFKLKRNSIRLIKFPWSLPWFDDGKGKQRGRKTP